MNRVAVVGAGTMGHGIAQSFLMGGYPVRLYDIKESILETAKTHIQKNLACDSMSRSLAIKVGGKCPCCCRQQWQIN